MPEVAARRADTARGALATHKKTHYNPSVPYIGRGPSAICKGPHPTNRCQKGWVGGKKESLSSLLRPRSALDPSSPPSPPLSSSLINFISTEISLLSSRGRAEESDGREEEGKAEAYL